MGKSRQLIELDLEKGPFYRPVEVVLTRAKGSFMGCGGRRYIDMMGAYSTASLGHCHPDIIRSLVRQAPSWM